MYYNGLIFNETEVIQKAQIFKSDLYLNNSSEAKSNIIIICIRFSGELTASIYCYPLFIFGVSGRPFSKPLKFGKGHCCHFEMAENYRWSKNAFQPQRNCIRNLVI